MDMITTLDEPDVSLDVAADQRQWQLERLDKQTRRLVELVREEYANGVPVQTLAKRAKVTRATIYAWVTGSSRTVTGP